MTNDGLARLRPAAFSSPIACMASASGIAIAAKSMAGGSEWGTNAHWPETVGVIRPDGEFLNSSGFMIPNYDLAEWIIVLRSKL